ncbi:hypothetical protein diail_8878 [Diaporthe ilicicola]|nr:hypothetical protein diail_8878 [Diaporthe ilicicola]
MNIWSWFRNGGPLLGGAIVLALNNNAAAKKKGKVQRADGIKVKIRGEKSSRAEFRALWQASKRKDILLLLPIFWAPYSNQYSGNFQTYYFGLISTLLDYKGFSVKKRINIGFYYIIALHIIAWTDNISELSRFSGILRGQESFSQAVAFGLNTKNWHGGHVPLIVNMVLLGLAIYPTYLVMRDHVPVEAGSKQPVEEASIEEAAAEGSPK